MQTPPIPENEQQRLGALQRYGVLDTPPQAQFDDFTHLAAHICGTPIALISLVDTERQWFKSKFGLEAPQTPREVSFCGHAIRGQELFEIPNALEDERFHDNPLVTGDPHVIFYAGAPLLTAEGLAIGTLCVIDHTPRQLTPQQREALARLSRQVIAQLELGHANRGLAQSEERLHRFVGATQHAVLFHEKGILLDANPALGRLSGFSLEEMIGTPILSYFTPETVATVLLHSSGVETSTYEAVSVRKDGSRFAVEITSGPFLYGGRTVRFVNMQDITEKKRDQETLRAQSAEIARKNSDLERATKAKSDFLANMSHELRTPLNSIIGVSEMMKDGLLGELDVKQRSFVTDVFDAGRHLLSLINDILDLSKVEAGMLKLDSSVVDVAALLKSSLLIVREKANKQGIRLDAQIDPALGAMQTDERKVKQMTYNLLSNAVKFTPGEGTVMLFARRCTRAQVALDAAWPGRLLPLAPGAESEFIEIAVQDSGAGIAEADLAKLFQPFTQVDGSMARRHAGTGLGLSLVRRLAELHGGTVGVSSRLGAGSRFSVWLPRRESALPQTG